MGQKGGMMEHNKRRHSNLVKKRRKDLIKNKNDKRYIERQKRLEHAIGKYLKSGWLTRLKTSKVSREAKVWNSTFYDHYLHMDEAVNLFFHKMDPELKRLAKEAAELGRHLATKGKPKKNPANVSEHNLELMFYKILYFVYQNREYYETIIGQGYLQALVGIAEPFQLIITQSWSNYGIEAENECFCIFSWELGGALYHWGNYENFDFDRMPQYAKKLSWLAQNATKRLMES